MNTKLKSYEHELAELNARLEEAKVISFHSEMVILRHQIRMLERKIKTEKLRIAAE